MIYTVLISFGLGLFIGGAISVFLIGSLMSNYEELLKHNERLKQKNNYESIIYN